MNQVLTPSIIVGGRRSRRHSRKHGSKRKGNKSLTSWVAFVKKVAREEKLPYGKAMKRASVRKNKGEKWMTGGDGPDEMDVEPEEYIDENDDIKNMNIDQLYNAQTIVTNEIQKIGISDTSLTDEEQIKFNNLNARKNAIEEKINLINLNNSSASGGRRRSKKSRRSKKRRGSRRRHH